MPSATQTTAANTEAVPTGNTYDKYGSKNPVVRRLMTGFHGCLDELLADARLASILDVGCGEGVLTHDWAEKLSGCRVVGIDFDDAKLRAEWEKRADLGNLAFTPALGERLPFEDGEFEMVSAIEVLEHVPEPRQVLAEMSRVASRCLLVSVPREPLWRALNMARGSYWRHLGDTPGHLNHWSRRGFARLLSEYGTVAELRSPFPWTMALVRL